MRIAVWRQLVSVKKNPENLMRLWKDEHTENEVEIFLETKTNKIYQKYMEGTAEGYEEHWYILQR
jgi:hypothetical protein